MPKKTAVKQNRWTLTCGEEFSRPKKPSYLAVAVEQLGPFAHETKAQALEHEAYFEHRGQRFGISRELALEFLDDTARRFNTEEYLACAAPRFKYVVERLKETQRLADELAGHLDSLDDITRHELQHAGTNTEHQRQFRALMEAADANGLPRASTDKTGSAASWVDRLRRLSSYAEVTSVNLVCWRGQRNLSEIDKGGNTNLWNETIGIPRWGLVNDAIQIYETFKPGEATGTESGPFHQFILALFEYATGREGNKHAKVEDWLKKLVPAHRKDKRAEAKEAKLDVEWNEIIVRDPELRIESNRERIIEIEAALGKSQRDREALWQIMWPHVRLRHQLSGS